MTGWGRGAVTDIACLPGYQPEQSPHHLAAACLIAGVEAGLPGPADPFRYVELGCGPGFGALVLAASNPGWQVLGIDINPAHIAAARALAAAAGLANARFLEADLATLPEAPELARVPEADLVTLAGVWSRVGPAVRAGILRLLRARVRAGGLVHVTYDALPAWQGGFGLQRLVRAAGLRLAHGTDRQVLAGLGVAQALLAAEAPALAGAALPGEVLRCAAGRSPSALAHDFMTADWAPCFHADVAAAMAEAKLDWVGSAALPENFPSLMLTEAQRAMHDRFDDPLLRELVKDTCSDRLLRQDVFVRGPTRLTAAGRDAALRALWLAPLVRPEDAVFELDTPAGTAVLDRGFYGAVMAGLAQGSQPVGALVAAAGGSDNPAEVVALLTGAGQAMVAGPAASPAPATAHRFNAAAARLLVRPETLGHGAALAAPAWATGLPVPVIDLFLAERIAAAGGVIAPALLAASLDPDPASRTAITARLTAALERRLALWQGAGAL